MTCGQFVIYDFHLLPPAPHPDVVSFTRYTLGAGRGRLFPVHESRFGIAVVCRVAISDTKRAIRRYARVDIWLRVGDMFQIERPHSSV